MRVKIRSVRVTEVQQLTVDPICYGFVMKITEMQSICNASYDKVEISSERFAKLRQLIGRPP